MIIFVVDVHSGVTAADHEVATLLQKSGRPTVLCVNKCDSIGDTPLDIYEFYDLGIGEPIAVSSVHGHGTGDLLDAVCEHLEKLAPEENEREAIKVAVIGRPNVGKSTLVNCILGEQRMIVSDVAGTTRDAVDATIENQHGRFVFIDTAGLRKKGRIDDEVERFSAIQSACRG